jgi:hypothetical protein
MLLLVASRIEQAKELTTMSRKFFAPLVVAAAVAAGGVGGALIGVPALSGASETPTTQSAPAATAASARSGALAAAADALGISGKDLAKDLKDGKTIADVAKDKGVDVNTVIDAMVAKAVANGHDEAKAKAAITKFVNEGGAGKGIGQGHPRVRHAVRTELDSAAQALGMQPSALAQELKGGKTIAQVAQEKGVDVNTVIDAMVAPVKERITKFVNEGGRRAHPSATDSNSN